MVLAHIFDEVLIYLTRWVAFDHVSQCEENVDSDAGCDEASVIELVGAAVYTIGPTHIPPVKHTKAIPALRFADACSISIVLMGRQSMATSATTLGLTKGQW